MTRPKLVIFDCDGVLVDSEGAHAEVLSLNLARHGLAMTPAAIRETFAGTMMAAIGASARERGADLPDDWVDEIYGELFERLREGVPVVAGIHDVLDTLNAAGIPFCVASNGSEQKMAITLGGNRLLDRFDGRVFSAHAVGTGKPEPGLFKHAAGHFGVAPADCIVIEDSVTGAVAAQRAGMPCLGYAPAGDGERLAKAGATPFADMAALPGLLGIGRT